MKLAVDSFPFVIHQFEGVASIPIHVLISIRNTTITEQEADLMSGLWTQSDEIPEHVRILQNSRIRSLSNHVKNNVLTNYKTQGVNCKFDFQLIT